MRRFSFLERALAAFFVIAAILGVSACARNGLGGYELPKIFRK